MVSLSSFGSELGTLKINNNNIKYVLCVPLSRQTMAQAYVFGPMSKQPSPASNLISSRLLDLINGGRASGVQGLCAVIDVNPPFALGVVQSRCVPQPHVGHIPAHIIHKVGVAGLVTLPLGDHRTDDVLQKVLSRGNSRFRHSLIRNSS